MTTTVTPRGILSGDLAPTTVGMFSMIAFVAFEAMAVTTVMPTLAADLHGLDLYALSFAAPMASGVVGMVAAGRWSDRSGPTVPLLASLALFAIGLVVCGLAPTMPFFVGGRVLQGLGGGALTVGLYVVVGLVYPARLQPAIFASFAAAWVLPSLFGPWLAAVVAAAWGWRWVFLGIVALVGVALLLILGALRRLEPHAEPSHTPVSRLWWSVVGAGAVLALELLGSADGLVALVAVPVLALVIWSLIQLLPRGTLTGGRGLPAVIATRGLLSAAFYCANAYIVYVGQQRWGLSPEQAGLALSVVGVLWALASQAQSRVGDRLAHHRVMWIGTAVVLLGLALLAAGVIGQAITASVPLGLPLAGFMLTGLGMGFAYPRTSVAMLAESTDADRGFNSSALTVADSLGGALALSFAGVCFAAGERFGVDPFSTVFVLGALIAMVGVAAAGRTGHPEGSAPQE